MVARYFMEFLPKTIWEYYNSLALKLREFVVVGFLTVFDPKLMEDPKCEVNSQHSYDFVISVRVILPFYVMMFYHSLLSQFIENYIHPNFYFTYYFIFLLDWYILFNVAPTLVDWAYVFDARDKRLWVGKVVVASILYLNQVINLTAYLVLMLFPLVYISQNLIDKTSASNNDISILQVI